VAATPAVLAAWAPAVAVPPPPPPPGAAPVSAAGLLKAQDEPFSKPQGRPCASLLVVAVVGKARQAGASAQVTLVRPARGETTPMPCWWGMPPSARTRTHQLGSQPLPSRATTDRPPQWRLPTAGEGCLQPELAGRCVSKQRQACIQPRTPPAAAPPVAFAAATAMAAGGAPGEFGCTTQLRALRSSTDSRRQSTTSTCARQGSVRRGGRAASRQQPLPVPASALPSQPGSLLGAPSQHRHSSRGGAS
jgi:hypothetical protein